MLIVRVWRVASLASAMAAGIAAPGFGQVVPGGPLSVTYPQATPAPAGMVVMDAPADDGYTLSPPRIHGFLTTGISTGGGTTLQGGVIIPVVPGRVDLQVSGGTGQAPVLVPNGKGWKTKGVKYTDYAAAVHVHATDDIDITVAVSGLNAKGPAWGSPVGVP